MREIKFRGMAINGEWYYGLLAIPTAGEPNKGVYISNKVGRPFAYEVRPETVGQLTGLKDKNGVEIYEGDIVVVPEGYGGDNMYNSFIGHIDYDAPDFYISQRHSIEKTGKWSGQDYQWNELEVIGNIYENPKLLKE